MDNDRQIVKDFLLLTHNHDTNFSGVGFSPDGEVVIILAEPNATVQAINSINGIPIVTKVVGRISIR